MSFFVSESLKNVINEECLIEDNPNIKFEDKVFVKIDFDDSTVFCKLTKIKYKNKTFIKFSMPETIDVETIEKLFLISNWKNFRVLAGESLDTSVTLIESKPECIKMQEIVRSRIDNSYVFTIVIHNNKVQEVTNDKR